MSNASDFEIKKGVLTKYKGPGGDVIVPDGVTEIGDEAFKQCQTVSSVTLPESIIRVGKQAFAFCTALTEIVLPASVSYVDAYAFRRCTNLLCATINGNTSALGSGAFSECEHLEKVRLPDALVEIESYAFYNCSDLNEIIIPEKVQIIGYSAFANCKKLVEVIVPNGVISLSNDRSYSSGAFENCSALKRVSLPPNLTSIGARSFKGCKRLKEINIPDNLEEIGEDAFKDCKALRSIAIPATIRKIGLGAFSNCTSLERSQLIKPEHLYEDDALLLQMNSSTDQLYRFDGSVKKHMTFHLETSEEIDSLVIDYLKSQKCVLSFSPDSAAFFIAFQSPKWADAAIRANYGEKAASVLDKTLALLEPVDRVSKTLGDRLISFVSFNKDSIGKDRIAALYDFLKQKKCSVVKDFSMILSDLENVDDLDNNALSNCDHYKEYSERLKKLGLGTYTDVTKKLIGKIKKGIHYNSSDEKCPAEMVIYVINAYASQMLTRPTIKTYNSGTVALKKDSVADEFASVLNQEELLQQIEPLCSAQGLFSCLIPYARYADEERVRRLLNDMEKWADYEKGTKASKSNAIIARSGLMLNDTLAAQVYFDSIGKLKGYAKLRKMSENSFRDQVMSNIDLDASGKHIFDLGNRTVAACLDDQFHIFLADQETHERVEPLHDNGENKKTAEVAIQLLRDRTAAIVANRFAFLRKAFLSGEEFEAADWENAYLNNPILNRCARIIVWAQGGSSFVLTENGAVDSNGGEYRISESPIKVAHPMEMREAEADAWRMHFAEHGIKQPFLQIWEPVIAEENVKEDRYNDCLISYEDLYNHESDGIKLFTVLDETFTPRTHIRLKDCSLESYNDTLFTNEGGMIIRGFHYDKWNRQTNHIVSLFDNWTILGRIRKDDMSIVEQLGQFTYAQIMEFIDLASQNNCTNVLAALLHYRNEHFGDYAPMDVFSLDL